MLDDLRNNYRIAIDGEENCIQRELRGGGRENNWRNVIPYFLKSMDFKKAHELFSEHKEAIRTYNLSEKLKYALLMSIGLNVIDVDDQNELMSLVRSRWLRKKEKYLRKLLPNAGQLIKYYSYCRNTCQDPTEYLSQHTDINDISHDVWREEIEECTKY